MIPHTPPGYGVRAFNCPYCRAFSNMEWRALLRPLVLGVHQQQNSSHMVQGIYCGTISEATCVHCMERSYWVKTSNGRWDMVWPDSSEAPLPHDELPEDLRQDYLEARSVVAKSPRAAAALLRLTVQKLCKSLGESGENINADIGALVDKGLPVQVQRSLDAVRVIGNNAIHPGEMSVDDVTKVALTLFDIVNFIVDDRIAKPRRLAEIYEGLPGGALDGIKKRDS